MLDHIRPQYAKRFRCIGGECEDNCCHGWEVTVDKATYKKYQAIPALRKILAQSFALTNNPDDNKYAVIKHTASTNCPMLLEDGLCRIHKEFGADYLPTTCATYPRCSRRVDGLLEQPLQLSCPEAARLVLLEPQLLTPRRGFTESSRYASFLTKKPENAAAQVNASRYYWEGREFSLMLVQDRSYPLWQRLFLLGMFCKRLDAVIAEHRAASIPNLLREYAEIIRRGDLRSSMDGIPARPAAQLKMVLDVVTRRLAPQDLRITRFRQCLRDFLRGTGHEDSAQKLDAAESQVTLALTLETCTPHYLEAYERYYAPFMEKHPFLIENYLINHIIRMGFPFRSKTLGQIVSPLQQFVLMCLEYAVIKGLLIGMSGHYRDAFAPEHVVKLIQVVTKSIEHSETLLPALNWQGLADPNSIAALLKN